MCPRLSNRKEDSRIPKITGMRLPPAPLHGVDDPGAGALFASMPVQNRRREPARTAPHVPHEDAWTHRTRRPLLRQKTTPGLGKCHQPPQRRARHTTNAPIHSDVVANPRTERTVHARSMRRCCAGSSAASDRPSGCGVRWRARVPRRPPPSASPSAQLLRVVTAPRAREIERCRAAST